MDADAARSPIQRAIAAKKRHQREFEVCLDAELCETYAEAFDAVMAARGTDGFEDAMRVLDEVRSIAGDRIVSITLAALPAHSADPETVTYNRLLRCYPATHEQRRDPEYTVPYDVDAFMPALVRAALIAGGTPEAEAVEFVAQCSQPDLLGLFVEAQRLNTLVPSVFPR